MKTKSQIKTAIETVIKNPSQKKRLIQKLSKFLYGIQYFTTALYDSKRKTSK